MSLIENGWGLDIILWFQSWRTALVAAAGQVFHYAGSEDFYLVVLPLIYWCFDAAFGRRLAVLFMLSNWSNSCFKSWWRRPRPFMVSEQVENVVIETGYGLPSGHAQGTTTLWGAVALRLKRSWVTILVAAYVLLMMISRMALGVHYPQDVIAGTVIALAWLGLYAWLEPKISDWLNRQGMLAQVGIVAAFTAIMLLFHPGLVSVSSPRWLPQEISLESLLAGPVTPIAAFLGLGIGFVFEVRYVRFRAGGRWWKCALRFFLGLAVVLALRLGLGILFEGLGPALIFRFIRYGLIGFWAGFGAPWLFVRLGLAEQQVRE